MENHSSNRAERRRRGAWGSAPTTQRQGELFWLAFWGPGTTSVSGRLCAPCVPRSGYPLPPPVREAGL
jgi:hypothetical protein